MINSKVEEAISALEEAGHITKAELSARANAHREMQAAIVLALTVLKAIRATGKVSSDDMATLAARILRTTMPAKINTAAYAQLLDDAQSLAGSVMSQADGEAPDPRQQKLDIGVATRGLVDAQKTGQALPLERTVVIGEGSTGLDKLKETDNGS